MRPNQALQRKTATLGILIFTFLVSLCRPLCAEVQASQQFGVIGLSPDLLAFDPAKAEEFSKSYPLLPNPCTVYLPGKLYDVRKRFEPVGVKFRQQDFAWFNPHLSVLVVGAAPQDLALLRSFVEGGVGEDILKNLPPEGRNHQSAVNLAPKDGPSHRMAFPNLYGTSGQRTISSATGGGGIDYHLAIAPVTGPDGVSFEYSMELKIRYGGKNYALMKSSTVPFSKVETQLVGTTPSGERVEFHLSTKAIWVADEPSFMDERKWKESVLQCVRSAP